MANAKTDGNRTKTLLGVSSADSLTPIAVEAEPVKKSLNVNITGDDVGIGGGTSYTEDVATANPIVGTATLIERDDQLAAVTPVAGDWIGLRGTAKGALWVALADASGDPITAFGGGTEYTEDVATANPQVGKALMMERDDILAAVTPVEGDWIGARGSAEGALWTQDFNSDTITTHLSEIEGAVETIEGMFGTAGTADSQVISVQGVAGMTALSVTESTPLTGFATSAKQLADGHNVALSATDNAVLDNIALYTAGSETALEKMDNHADLLAYPVIDSNAEIAINVAAGANSSILAAPGANKQIWVLGLFGTADVAGTVALQDEDDVAHSGVMTVAVGGGWVLPISPDVRFPWVKVATNKALEIDTVTCTFDGILVYLIADVS